MNKQYIIFGMIILFFIIISIILNNTYTPVHYVCDSGNSHTVGIYGRTKNLDYLADMKTTYGLYIFDDQNGTVTKHYGTEYIKLTDTCIRRSWSI